MNTIRNRIRSNFHSRFSLKIVCIAISCSFIGFSSASAQQLFGGYAESYLRRDVGARAIGLGGAYSAVSNEPTTMYYNPAGLSMLAERPQFSSMISVLSLGRSQNYAAYGQTFFGWLGVGASINSFGGGEFTARAANGTEIGVRNPSQQALSLGIATKIRNFSVGVSGKYLRNTLTGGANPLSADGWALDAGMKLNVQEVLTFAISAQNFASSFKWNNQKGLQEKLPYSVRAGLATEFGLNSEEVRARTNVLGIEKRIKKNATTYVLLSLDATMTSEDEQPRVAVGAEFVFGEIIAFRGGTPVFVKPYSGSSFLQFDDFGLGMSLRPTFLELPFQVQFDYAVSRDFLQPSGLAHHISLLMQF